MYINNFRKIVGYTSIFLLFIFTSFSAYAENDINRQVEILIDDLLSVTKGDVLKGTDNQVYINVGQQQGVVAGNQFEIIRLGDLLVEGEPEWGHEETVVAKAEVEKVRDKISICKILNKTNTPLKGDKAYILRKKVKVLVIGQFVYNKGFNVLTKSIQEKISTLMTARGIQVVERDQLERVLKEQKLGYSGLVNINTAKKIGELLGAEGLLIGTVSDLGNTITVNARLVDIGTGNALSASEVELHKTPTIAELLDTPINEEMFGQNNAISSTSPKQSYKKNPPQKLKREGGFQNNFLRIEARSVNRSKDKRSITVGLAITNITENDVYIGAGSVGAILLNDHQGHMINFTGRNTGLGVMNGMHSQFKKLRNYTLINSGATMAVLCQFISREPINKESISLFMELLKHSGEDGDYSKFSASLPNLPFE